jgi:hypothetical protein
VQAKNIFMFFAYYTQAVLWIRIGFHADPDPDFDQTFESQKVELLHEKYRYLKKVKGQKTYLRRYESFFEKQKTRFICKFLPISMLLDPDPHS